MFQFSSFLNQWPTDQNRFIDRTWQTCTNWLVFGSDLG